MSVVIVTGSAGLIGAEAVRFFADKGFDVVGIDNDMRAYFFGPEASTVWSRRNLEKDLQRYTHVDADIRDEDSLRKVFKRHQDDIAAVVHTASQPSHDWAAREPLTDFTINANGTLLLLEMTRNHCPASPFIFTSTNKVYGDRPNDLPFVEEATRWELPAPHPYAAHGVDESMSIDHCLHSLFGASKVAADILVQEYGRYFGMNTVSFRGGCLTGSGHSGAALHGFLAYLAKCAVTGSKYRILGYGGKQVRDNIHSVDLVSAFWEVMQAPRGAQVYNIGGGRRANCSILEAISILEELTGHPMNLEPCDEARVGDHKWWISDTRRFESHYPAWSLSYGLRETIADVHAGLMERGLERGLEHAKAE